MIIKGSKVLYEWIALRPGRDEIRLESQNRKSNNGKEFMVCFFSLYRMKDIVSGSS